MLTTLELEEVVQNEISESFIRIHLIKPRVADIADSARIELNRLRVDIFCKNSYNLLQHFSRVHPH